MKQIATFSAAFINGMSLCDMIRPLKDTRGCALRDGMFRQKQNGLNCSVFMVVKLQRASYSEIREQAVLKP